MSLDLSGLLGKSNNNDEIAKGMHEIAKLAKRNLTDFQLQLADAAAYMLSILISSGKITGEKHMQIIHEGANIAGCVEHILFDFHKDITKMDEDFGTGTFPKLIVSPIHVGIMFTFDSTNSDIKKELGATGLLKDNFYDLTSVAKAGPGDHVGRSLRRARFLIERSFRSHNTR